MKKIISLLCAVLILGTSVFAMEDKPVPTLLVNEVEKVEFEVTVEGSTFELTLDENPSTGYMWGYTLSDEEKLTVISDEYIMAESAAMGASGKRVYKFEVKTDGVYTILFKYERSFEENSTIEELDLLVYMNDGKLIIEENQVVTIMDSVIVEEISKGIIVDGAALQLDVMTEVIDGITMVPLALPLRALGYEVTWHPETESVEISKGAQWTSIKINENAYFVNRMAASPLTSAPVIKSGRTLVPVEFFTNILKLGVTVENYNLILEEKVQTQYSGKIVSIEYDETGSGQILLSIGTHDTSESYMNEEIILHVGSAFTYIQGELNVDDMIVAFTSDVTTMSIPAQTSAYVIYKSLQAGDDQPATE